MNCRKRGVQSLRLGHRYAVGLEGTWLRKLSQTRKTIPEASVNLGLS